jgi:hypothetical protein
MRGPGAGPRRYLGDAIKKQMKKLVLSRETLVSLEHELGKAAGGATTTTGTDSGVNTCPTSLTHIAQVCGGWTIENLVNAKLRRGLA